MATLDRRQFLFQAGKVLHDKSVDAIVIATPDHGHALTTSWILPQQQKCIGSVVDCGTVLTFPTGKRARFTRPRSRSNAGPNHYGFDEAIGATGGATTAMSREFMRQMYRFREMADRFQSAGMGADGCRPHGR